jgi:hypothetical protein
MEMADAESDVEAANQLIVEALSASGTAEEWLAGSSKLTLPQWALTERAELLSYPSTGPKMAAPALPG